MGAELQCLLAACLGELDKLAPKPKPVAYFGRFLGVNDRMHALLSGVYGHPVHGNSTGEAITSRVHGIAYGAGGEVERVETANTVYRRVPR